MKKKSTSDSKKFVTENYCDECENVVNVAFDHDAFWAFKVGRVRCKACGTIVKPCNECFGTDIDRVKQCAQCPWERAAITDEMTEDELAAIAKAQGEKTLEAMPVPYHVELPKRKKRELPPPADWNCNKCGVPYHGYTLTLKDGREVEMDVANEEDWGNIQRCFTDWNGKTHRECVGWGDADKWVEITDVFDGETEDHLDPMAWAQECVWCYGDRYSR